MQKQKQPISGSLPPPNQESKKPSMENQQGTAPTRRPAGRDDIARTEASSAPEDFEFCVLSSVGLALAGEDDAAGMCVADEVFSGGKLLPLRLSSANSADASALLLLRSDSLDDATAAPSTSGFSSRSDSRSASFSRSTSSKSTSSDPAGLGSWSNKSACSTDAVIPQPRSLSSCVFYTHPSPSPRPPRRSGRSAAPAARRSTGSAPPAAWGIIRLGVVGAPEVYPTRPAEYRKAATARSGSRSRSRSARLQQTSAATKEAAPADKKLALGLLGAGLVCSCSPDAVAPVGSAEVAAAEARRRKKKAEEKKRAAKQSGHGTVWESRILEWLEELSIAKEKNVAYRSSPT